MQPFDADKCDISLFLALFQRLAKQYEVEKKYWTTQLMSVLPADITEIILRESEDKIDDFDYVKTILLQRFQLSPEKFRLKFVQHQKQAGALWKDLKYDLETYLNEYLKGLEINSFDELKKLMVTDQLKRRASPEMREHFIDNWCEFKEPAAVAKKFDDYESVRKVNKKSWNPKPNFDKSYDRKFERKSEQPFERKFEKFNVKDKENWVKKDGEKNVNWRERNHNVDKNSSDEFQKERSKIFEARKTISCFSCGGPHFKLNCPKLNSEKNKNMINNVQTSAKFNEDFKPYLNKATINQKEITYLRDSGSILDLIPNWLINEDQLTGETVWVKQPLENHCHCLPVANVELNIKGVGLIKTKAGVVGKEVDMSHYLLGNATHELIEKKTNGSFINAVQTRGQAKQFKGGDVQRLADPGEVGNGGNSEGTSQPERSSDKNAKGRENETLTDEISQGTENGGKEDLLLPGLEKDEVSDLAYLSAKDFKSIQMSDDTLVDIRKRAQENKSNFEIDKGIIYRNVRDHHGNSRKQIVVPKRLRVGILKACHEGISAHLGMAKTKDKVFRFYFWPNVVKETEDYVKTCDPCQRFNKKGDQVKAPLKLVPIITEVFSRVCCDIVGPLPPSEKDNRYLLTAICVASRYPEVVPIADTKSETVVEALLWVFSRLGFPKQIQCDLGTCFTSNLTTTFLEKFGIKIIHSSVHHPQSNLIERYHKTMKRLLKVLCFENKNCWEKNLPHVLLALRTVTHESTGFSPAELVHGKNLRTPEALLFEKWTEVEGQENLVTEYVFDLVNRLKKCQDLAAERKTVTRDKRKLWYDKNAIERKFQPGDKVLVLAISRANKMSVNWLGPGEIESKLSETNYIVKLPGRREPSQIYHVNLLKPYFQRVELINVLITEDFDPNWQEVDLDIAYPNADPEVFNYDNIIKDSNLMERCNSDQIDELGKLLHKYKTVFSNEPGRTNLIEHDIDLLSEKPVRLRPYRTSPRQTAILKSEIARMLELGIIIEGESDYAAPMILVEAPGREPRPCIDYRKLNEVTRVEFFPMPNIEDRVEEVSRAEYITVIDLTKGYWQIPLTPRAQKIAAFITTWGSFLPQVLPFGLIGGPYKFSKFMSKLLKGLEAFCLPYLDDMAVFSATWEEHLKHLEVVLQRLKEANLKVKLAKCKFAQKHVKYLGHVVGGGIRTPAEAKIQAVLDFPAPKSKTEIRKVLGMSGYYSRYLKNYATLVEPLTRALKGKHKREKIEWTDEMDRSLKGLKQALTEKPVLYAPNYEKDFIVQTDASEKGIGVVMAQREGQEEHPILYLSRKFTKAEKNYSTTEKECAGIIFAIKKLRHYLDGQKFIIETDHNPLVWLKTNSGSNNRLLRWALALQPFNYEVRHRAGAKIPHVDCLSRL